MLSRSFSAPVNGAQAFFEKVNYVYFRGKAVEPVNCLKAHLLIFMQPSESKYASIPG
jgi:hypothetical protein